MSAFADQDRMANTAIFGAVVLLTRTCTNAVSHLGTCSLAVRRGALVSSTTWMGTHKSHCDFVSLCSEVRIDAKARAVGNDDGVLW